MEHQPGLLPGRAAGGIPLRPRAAAGIVAEGPGCRPLRGPDRGGGAEPAPRPVAVDAGAGPRLSRALAGRHADPFGGRAVLRPLRNRAAAPGVAGADASGRGGRGAVEPLRREQSRQSDRPAGLSRRHRTRPGPRGSEERLEPGLPAFRRARGRAGRRPVAPRRRDRRRQARRRRALQLAGPAPLDRPGRHSVEPAARRDQLCHHGPGLRAVPLGRAPGALPADVRPRLPGRSPAVARRGHGRSGDLAHAGLRAGEIDPGHLPVRRGCPLHQLFPHRPGLPPRPGGAETRRLAPDRVLPVSLDRRRDRRRVQRLRGARGVQRQCRVPGGAGAVLPRPPVGDGQAARPLAAGGRGGLRSAGRDRHSGHRPAESAGRPRAARSASPSGASSPSS